MLIREVILENFMSYEYARIPLKSGVNVVCGPNGAGKSSMLLGISVALGQSYTERSKKLSDLIRWGKDMARVTLVLDNSPRGKRRPVPTVNKDDVRLSRVLRRDGKYWFELENRDASKEKVLRLLSRFGIDPDNLLVIMHQNMVEQFTVLSPQEKLRMVEAAVGLEPYRQNVLKARQKLSRILSEEESVGKLLDSAEQTLRYWREQYDRYQQKKQLLMKRRFLERELRWAEISKRERTVAELKAQVEEKQKEILEIRDETESVNQKLKDFQESLVRLKAELHGLVEERISLAYEKARHELSVSMAGQSLDEIGSWAKASQKGMQEFLGKIEGLEKRLHEVSNPVDLKSQLTEIREAYKSLGDVLAQRFGVKMDNLKEVMEGSAKQLEDLGARISDVEAKAGKLNLEIDGVGGSVLDFRVKSALLAYRKSVLSDSLEKLNRHLQGALAELNEAVEKAEAEAGPRLVTLKAIEEILGEMRVTDGHLAALADVSEDIERMYESYSKLYLELKEKASLVAENREKALEEVKARMEAWKGVIQNLLDHVNLRYSAVLSEVQADGKVQLVGERDIEAAGLEIFVGFRGSVPVPLDAYTQSGGERSTSIMAFLLALQQHIRSPFRAVDEYDTHMDPRNREIIANVLVSSVVGAGAQYLAITPSQITFTGKDVHIVTVQNVEGASLIKEVAQVVSK
jgi:chromosome segregation ATPase